ncbi:hypothetical protein ES754_04355 [Psychrobacter frigidicola]|uniref:Uncharacterized protein n=1 Tax=Psychrobacter frigidicola TaxID=45611 RepID=A0A5C7A652_9GAMM|nr:hypothetical protein [Psychrobacter frigidicola]TXD98175.1 hypothetical protein ES754_04355 [Psychrobacter frigidicola]
MSDNPIKTDLEPQHGTYSRVQAGKRGLLLRFTIFMAWVVGIGLLLSFLACTPVEAKPIASDNSSGYYIDLSKNVSGQASRYLLAFFVPDNSPASQAVTIQSSTAPKAQLSATRDHSLISIASHLLTDYDGLTLQNKIAVRRICRAVTNVTESKTRHPISLLYSVAFTQKTLGAIHHG